MNNFRNNTSLELTPVREEGDVMFVANPMWAERADFEYYKNLKKKVVLRLDNIPEDWNNRGTAISKLKDFIGMADVLIYQSNWSKRIYEEFIKSHGIETRTSHVIHNGVDTSIFNPGVLKENALGLKGDPKILFVKSSRNENKRWPEGLEMFRRYWQKNNKAHLYLVGQFADDIRKYNFGFYNGESVSYMGMLPQYEMAKLYRSVDILYFPAYADCAPNVVLEAMACGVVPIIHPYGGGIEFVESDTKMHGVFNKEIWDADDYEWLINQAEKVNRGGMVNHVKANFNIELMVTKYDYVLKI